MPVKPNRKPCFALMGARKPDRTCLQAMDGEAFAFVKYRVFRQQARKNGREELATFLEGGLHER